MAHDPSEGNRTPVGEGARREGFPRSRSPWGSQARVAGKRIWDIGNWGGASEQIGRRWEELALPRLQRLLTSGWRSPAGRELQTPESSPDVLPLTEEADLRRAVEATGLQNPDAILVGPNGQGNLVLRSVDFKWSLETASYRQVSAEALQALVEAAPQLQAAVDAVAAGIRGRGGVEGTSVERPASYVDGVFFAPDSESNRQFLDSAENRRQEYPLEPKEVVLAPVGGQEFFSVLLGWDLGLRLANLDRAVHLLDTLDGAERYYRLGSGIRGALITLATSLFADEPAVIDVGNAFDDLWRSLRPRTTADLVAHLGRRLQYRSEWLKQLRGLWRCPYRMIDLKQDLARRGVPVPSDEPKSAGPPPADWARWTELYRDIAQSHRVAVNGAGRALVAEGRTEPEAIGELARRRSEFAARTRARTTREIERMLARE